MYQVTVYNEEGCSGAAFHEVTLSTNEKIKISGDSLLCEGDVGQLYLPQTYQSYRWSTGDTTFQVNINGPGTYEVTVTEASGCMRYGSYKVNTYQNLDIFIEGASTLCPGQSITLDAGPSFASYQWSTGSKERIITVSEPGQYQVTATTTGGLPREGSNHGA